MKVSGDKLRQLCRRNRMTLSALLDRSGVSRNALYALLRKREILPRSLTAVAGKLGVSPSVLLEESGSPEKDMGELHARLNEIMRSHPGADRDHVRHALILLREPPVDRLRRALTRAQKSKFGDKEAAFLQELIRQKVDFMIVGLSAAILQGAPVVTQAVQLWFKDLGHPGIRKALQKVGGVLVPPVGLNPPAFAGEAVNLFDIVMHMHGLGDFDREQKTAVRVPLGRCKLAVLSLERVIASKKATGRPKDKLTLPVLSDTLFALQDHSRRRAGRRT